MEVAVWWKLPVSLENLIHILNSNIQIGYLVLQLWLSKGGITPHAWVTIPSSTLIITISTEINITKRPHVLNKVNFHNKIKGIAIIINILLVCKIFLWKFFCACTCTYLFIIIIKLYVLMIKNFEYNLIKHVQLYNK